MSTGAKEALQTASVAWAAVISPPVMVWMGVVSLFRKRPKATSALVGPFQILLTE